VIEKSYFYLAVTILLWGATPLIVSRLSVGLPISEINWIVTAFSIIILSIVILFSGKAELFRSYKKKDYTTMFIMGAIGIFPYTALYYLAFSLAPANAGNINIINYTWPVWIIILSVPLLKEALTWKKILGIILSFAGVYLIASGGNMTGFSVSHTSHYMPAYLSAAAGASGKKILVFSLKVMLYYILIILACSCAWFHRIAINMAIMPAGTILPNKLKSTLNNPGI